ncbi:MAG: Crp/Fnr family transcriptional regulator [Myxococcota bacterium]
MKSYDPEQLAAQIPLFAALEPAECRLIASLIRVQRFAQRSTVVWEGDTGGALYFILTGYLKALSRGADGNEVLLSVMGPGEVFGELSVLDGQPRSASVVALEPSELAVVERAPLLSLVQKSPALALGLIDVLTQRLRNLSKRCENISSLDIPARLAEVLVNLAERHGQRRGNDVTIPVRLSQQDLGNMVGATRESVNKQLRGWTQEGIVRQEEGRVVIGDLAALRRRVGGS